MQLAINSTFFDMPLFGLILAGGQSLRMGTNKAMLKPWGEAGPTLLEYTVNIITSLTQTYQIACAPNNIYTNYPCVLDQITGKGPALGLLSGLTIAQKLGFKNVLVLPCDVPKMRILPLINLIKEHKKQYQNTLATLYVSPLTQRIEMLSGIYSTNFLTPLLKGLEKGEKSIYQILDKDKCNIIPLPLSWLKYFYNCNTPDDLKYIAQS